MWYLVINKSRFKDSIKTTSISSRYRDGHPQYCERNRMLQKQRDAKRRAKHLAKMDALSGVCASGDN